MQGTEVQDLWLIHWTDRGDIAMSVNLQTCRWLHSTQKEQRPYIAPDQNCRPQVTNNSGRKVFATRVLMLHRTGTVFRKMQHARLSATSLKGWRKTTLEVLRSCKLNFLDQT